MNEKYILPEKAALQAFWGSYIPNSTHARLRVQLKAAGWNWALFSRFLKMHPDICLQRISGSMDDSEFDLRILVEIARYNWLEFLTGKSPKLGVS
jgi:hypothetical protein